MKRILLVLTLFICLQSQAQNQGVDSRLAERFTESQISNMDESRIAYWSYYLDNSFTVMDIPTEKVDHLSELEVIDISSSDFHGFSMLLDSYQKEGAYLKFKNENKMVAIKPIKQFIEEFNTYFQASKK
jgi:hypothetical protein